jgi:hypothetical protein
MFTSFSTILALFMVTGVRAAPLPLRSSLQRRGTPLKAAQLAGLAPYAQFARAAYCPPDKIKGWKCGAACAANSDFTLTLSGGDGDGVQYWFVGHTKTECVVAHQGTDPSKFWAVVTDLKVIPKERPHLRAFPGVPKAVYIHPGFRDVHDRTAETILHEVQRLIAAKKCTKVHTVGHSLGGALATLDALSLRLQLDPKIAVTATTFGAPRVGNEAFAQFFDSQIPGLKLRRVINGKDPVPALPRRTLGYVHTQGEIHILSPGKAVSCAGQDNSDDKQCENMMVPPPPTIMGKFTDHSGPYARVLIGTQQCT